MSNAYPSAMAGDIEDEDDNILPMIAPATGGKQPPNDWLSKLKVGVVFLCRRKDQDRIYLTQGFIANRTTEATYLILKGYYSTQEVWVDSANFSEEYTLVEILRTE